MGADMDSFMQGFYTGLKQYALSVPFGENTAKQYAHDLVRLFDGPCDGMVLWIYNHSLVAWGNWLVQLWGESVGKNETTRALPYMCTGPEDQHSLLQFFLDGPNNYIHSFIYSEEYGGDDFRLGDGVAGDFNGKTMAQVLMAQKESIALALNEAKRPLSQFEVCSGDFSVLGKFMCFWMFVTSYAGYLYRVNPFDQPAVEKGKIYCKQLLAGKEVNSPFSEAVEI